MKSSSKSTKRLVKGADHGVSVRVNGQYCPGRDNSHRRVALHLRQGDVYDDLLRRHVIHRSIPRTRSDEEVRKDEPVCADRVLCTERALLNESATLAITSAPGHGREAELVAVARGIGEPALVVLEVSTSPETGVAEYLERMSVCHGDHVQTRSSGRCGEDRLADGIDLDSPWLDLFDVVGASRLGEVGALLDALQSPGAF